MIRRARHPRGSIYVLVLSISMLVAVIGMGALMSARVQTRLCRNETDFATARLCARAGLEVAMFRIQQDPTWRTDLGNGVWFSNVPLNQGSFSVSAADPITGNISAASNDPVVLTCTGTRGSAVYAMQLMVQVSSTGLACTAVSACSGGNTVLSKCAFSSNQIASANGVLQISSDSSFNANAQAVGQISSNGAYVKSQQTITQPLALPDPVHVFDYYNSNGTAIPLASLAQSNATQLVSNTSFESNTTGWYIYSPSSSIVNLSRDSSVHQDGTKALLISGRSSTGDVPAIDLPLLSIRNGDTYAVKMPTYGSALLGLGSVSATIVLQTSNGAVSFSTSSASFPLLGSGWVTPQGNLTLSWTGTLSKATLVLTCTTSSGNLDIDAVSVTDTSLPLSAYVMDRVLLSPTSNPYGTPNANGIYIINCNGQTVTIGACRIVGTLVLLGGSGTTIQGPITWEPAVAGYPALLSDSSIAISFTGSAGLGEATYGVNFNPTGTPYPFVGGTANSNASDGFPSVINGLVYCGGSLTLPASTSPTFNGCLVTAGQLVFNASAVNVTYGNSSYLTPPPGFTTSVPSLYPVPGTWQRVTH